MAKTVSSPTGKPTHQEIAERAREIYEQSGSVPGRDLQNWLQAEAELTAAHKQVVAKDAARPATAKSNHRSARNPNSTYA